jgi:drug/metabolite transporter (DMT)-like permease
LRQHHPTSLVMLSSGLVSCPLLFLAAGASLERIVPQGRSGWLVLVGLALISHIGGQCLIAYALAHLRASFSSIALLWQPVVAAILAAAFLGEALTVQTIIGGTIILMGIAIAGNLARFGKSTANEA